jgi:hypothetical protein
MELHDGRDQHALVEGRFEAMLHWWQMPSDPELTILRATARRRRAEHQLPRTRR